MKVLTLSQQTLNYKQHIFFNLQVYAAVILLSLASLVSGTVEAASCQNYLQGELAWASSDSKKTIRLVMVSTEANSVQVAGKIPRMSYFKGQLNPGVGFLQNSLWGSNKAMMNDAIYWVDGGYPLVYSIDKWNVILMPGNSSMVLIKDGNTLTIPLECEGKLLSGNYVNYIQWGSYSWPSKYTKYVLSLSRYTYF